MRVGDCVGVGVLGGGLAPLWLRLARGSAQRRRWRRRKRGEASSPSVHINCSLTLDPLASPFSSGHKMPARPSLYGFTNRHTLQSNEKGLI